MATNIVGNLTDLVRRLETSIDDPVVFSAVIIRVVLRTGVDLRAPKPDQLRDTATLQRVGAVLAAMGYQL